MNALVRKYKIAWYTMSRFTNHIMRRVIMNPLFREYKIAEYIMKGMGMKGTPGGECEVIRFSNTDAAHYKAVHALGSNQCASCVYRGDRKCPTLDCYDQIYLSPDNAALYKILIHSHGESE
jgi:hypothetical protein